MIVANPAFKGGDGQWIANPAYRHYRDEDDLPTPEVSAKVEAPQIEDSHDTEGIETMLCEFEANVERSKRERWQGQERWQGRENEEARLINFLTPVKFIRRLQLAGIDARIEYSPYARFWLNNFTRAGRVGIGAHVKDDETGKTTTRVVSTLQDGVGPEWSLMRFNEYGVPTNERYRGWRTTLLQMIMAGVLTEAEAAKAFGPVPINHTSLFYRQQLSEQRRRKMGLQI